MTRALPCVHVIDDDPDVLDSLQTLLKSEGFDVRTYAAPSKFLACSVAELHGCVLTDLRMPEMSGIDLLDRMKALGLLLPVVVMSAYGDIAQAVRAIKLGAAEFIEKPFDGQKLLACLYATLETHRDPGLPRDERPAESERLAKLTPRENEVLAGIVEGKFNKIIAYELGISVRTIESHRARIMAKTGATSLSELVRMVLLARPEHVASRNITNTQPPDTVPER